MSSIVLIYFGFLVIVAAAVVGWRLQQPGRRCWLSTQDGGRRIAFKLIIVALVLLAGTIYIITHWAQATAQGG